MLYRARVLQLFASESVYHRCAFAVAIVAAHAALLPTHDTYTQNAFEKTRNPSYLPLGRWQSLPPHPNPTVVIAPKVTTIIPSTTTSATPTRGRNHTIPWQTPIGVALTGGGNSSRC